MITVSAKFGSFKAKPAVTDLIALPDIEDFSCSVCTSSISAGLKSHRIACGAIAFSVPGFDEIYCMLYDADDLPVYDTDGNAIYVQR